MEKRVWTKPLAEVEQFVANEYIAKCDDLVNKYFSFVCDAGGGVSGDVWAGGTLTGPDSRGRYTISGGENLTDGNPWGSYSACDATHYVPEADVASTFINGYYNKGVTNNSKTSSSFMPVVIWTDGGTNVHCTESLMDDIKLTPGNRS